MYRVIDVEQREWHIEHREGKMSWVVLSTWLKWGYGFGQGPAVEHCADEERLFTRLHCGPVQRLLDHRRVVLDAARGEVLPGRRIHDSMIGDRKLGSQLPLEVDLVAEIQFCRRRLSASPRAFCLPPPRCQAGKLIYPVMLPVEELAVAPRD